MTDQWKQLKATITEIKENNKLEKEDVASICKFLLSYMGVLEKKITDGWIPLMWDEYPTVNLDGNDDYVYVVDYSIPMPEEDEWVLITDVNHNVVIVQYDGYDFGDYNREDILAWQSLPKAYVG